MVTFGGMSKENKVSVLRELSRKKINKKKLSFGLIEWEQIVELLDVVLTESKE